jgi:hypothetical protein
MMPNIAQAMGGKIWEVVTVKGENHGLSEVMEDATNLHHAQKCGEEFLVQQDHARGAPRNVCPSDAHRSANVILFVCRGAAEAAPRNHDDVDLSLAARHFQHLLCVGRAN